MHSVNINRFITLVAFIALTQGIQVSMACYGNMSIMTHNNITSTVAFVAGIRAGARAGLDVCSNSLDTWGVSVSEMIAYHTFREQAECSALPGVPCEGVDGGA